MPPRAARQKNAIPAAVSVAGGSRLEQLPAELTQSIFDFLYDPSKYHQRDLIRPLSKHLCPYSTAVLYRSVSIGNDTDLANLYITLTSPSSARLVTSIVELEFIADGDAVEKIENLAVLLEKMVENLLLSLTNLKRLEVGNWDMVGKVVLSSRFGREGGKALESIKMFDCFGSIEGSIIKAWSHLRHLPVLSSTLYHNRKPSIAAEAATPTKLGGFEKVTNFTCALPDFSSSHATSFASLFPSALQQIKLVHLNKSIRPNYSPFLDSLSPDSITSINLNQATDIKHTSLDQFPVHQSLTRFPRLQHLKFYDSRIFDSELTEAIHGLNLTSLDIHPNCKLSYDLMHQLLSGITKESNLKKVKIGVEMDYGIAGRKYQDGAEPVLRNAILVPGAGWKRPTWSIITLPEARELERISIEKGVVLDGRMIGGLQVEREFEMEEKWLENVMKYMRTGPVDCRNCGEAP